MMGQALYTGVRPRPRSSEGRNTDKLENPRQLLSTRKMENNDDSPANWARRSPTGPRNS
ncbi:hypothetical protein JAAARDRAFT_27976, partial [Jaapia argillacea MUCL 33604]